MVGSWSKLYGKRNHDYKGKQKEKRAELNLFNPDEKRNTIIWTPELHLKFIQAVRVLGDNCIVTLSLIIY